MTPKGARAVADITGGDVVTTAFVHALPVLWQI